MDLIQYSHWYRCIRIEYAWHSMLFVVPFFDIFNGYFTFTNVVAALTAVDSMPMPMPMPMPNNYIEIHRTKINPDDINNGHDCSIPSTVLIIVNSLCAQISWTYAIISSWINEYRSLHRLIFPGKSQIHYHNFFLFSFSSNRLKVNFCNLIPNMHSKSIEIGN